VGASLSPQSSLAAAAKRPSGVSMASMQSSAIMGSQQAPIPEVPVLESMSVEQLIKAHTEASGVSAHDSGDQPLSLFAQMQSGIDNGADGGAPIAGAAGEEGARGEGLSTLGQRLQQISYGYQGSGNSSNIAAAGPKASEPADGAEDKDNDKEKSGKESQLRLASAQLLAPLQHTDTWAMMPVRKPLLTKRSRRCRLLVTPHVQEPDMNNPPQPRVCKSIVVKPQINPCSNPPFQKNNAAVAFVPRFAPWAWLGQNGVGEGGQPKMAKSAATSAAAALAAARSSGSRPQLKPGESAELIFALLNPLDSEVEVSLDTTVCNKEGQQDRPEGPGSVAELLTEQNVEVLTKPFATTLVKFNDLADVHDSFSSEDAARLDALKAADDKDVIPDRKMHKTLVRLRFQARESAGDAAAGAGPWVFYARMSLTFKDTSAKEHKVTNMLRFGSEATKIVASPPGVLEERAQAARAEKLREAPESGGADSPNGAAERD